MITSFDIKLFTKIAQLNQKELKKSLGAFLRKKYETVIETETYIYAVGDINVALVAHLDTIFTTKPEIFHDAEKKVLWSPNGLGADDRAGVYGIAHIILKTSFRPHIIFTTDEEVGCTGAANLSAIKNPFPNLKYIIQLDRKGKDECVFYGCGNEDFQNYVQTFGFTKEIGSCSDISFICPAWNVAGVNLSIGYENEHSYREYLNYDYLIETLQKIEKMLEDYKNDTHYEYIPKIEHCCICDKDIPVDKGYYIQETFVCLKCLGGIAE